jgi:DNA polymerase-4
MSRGDPQLPRRAKAARARLATDDFGSAVRKPAAAQLPLPPPARKRHPRRLGIETGADLKARPLAFLQQNFGKAGSWYYRIARAIDERPVEPDRPRKSVGADIFELAAARAELVPLIAKVWRYCEANEIRGRTVAMKVKYADFQ